MNRRSYQRLPVPDATQSRPSPARAGKVKESGSHTHEPAAADGETGRINAPAAPSGASATRVELVELLDHCETAMRAAAANLWDNHRDLAITLNQRAGRCHAMAHEIRLCEPPGSAPAGSPGAAGSALFVPLRREYFDAFAARHKEWEYRLLGGRWNADTCAVGRRVVLSCGYGKSRRLTGTITEFMVVQHPAALPGWVACYGSDAGPAACFRVAVDLPLNGRAFYVRQSPTATI